MITAKRAWIFERRGRLGGRGFTLVEILVVMGVIVVLAALLFASFSKSTAKAVVVEDMGKMKMIAYALSSFTAENGNKLPNQSTPLAGTDVGSGNRFNWHESVDRYWDPVRDFNPGSVYNYTKRANSPFSSRAARPFPGFRPDAPEQTSPLWVSYNGNVNNGRWQGKVAAVPDPARIVIVGETNHMGGEIRTDEKPTFEEDVQCRMRVSRPGVSALYLFADYHIEQLNGDHSPSSYAGKDPSENIWRWW